MAALSGCGDEPAAEAVGPATSNSRASEQATTALLTRSARALARALDDPNLRVQVKNDLRASQFPEHKLELGDYLQSVGAPLRAAMEANSPTGIPVEQLFDMEFYMPSAEHRASWTGGGNIIVALHNQADDDAPAEVAFNVSGEAVRLSCDNPPSTPTLVIGRAENSFTVPPSRKNWMNAGDDDVIGNWRLANAGTGHTIAAECDPFALEDCEEGGGGGGGIDEGFPTPSGAVHFRDIGVREFIDQMWAMNDHEPWDKGAPEFQLFFIGTSDLTQAAELKNNFLIPEDPWAGSDDGMNDDTREFGYEGLTVATWDRYWGDAVWVKCIEKDAGSNENNLTVTGPVPFTSEGTTYTVNVSTLFNDVTGGGDDDCGELDMPIRLSTGEWTRIYSEEDTEQNKTNNWHGTNDLRWNGYGVVY